VAEAGSTTEYASHATPGEIDPGTGYAHPPGYRMRRGRNWFFLGLTYASYYLCRYNLSPIAPELMNELKLTKTQYGLINTGRDGFYAIGQMINGLFTDRVGGKRAMTIGALSTVVLNLLFGLTTWSSFAYLLPLLVLIRSADGYMQAFGAPGFIKINTAWFRRKERGAFAGIFGAMINLGAIGAGQLGTILATGMAIPLVFFTLTIPKLDWRYMFIIPPMIVVVIVTLMNLMVKNTPEEAGYRIPHEDEGEAPAGDASGRVRLRDVFAKIASNPIIWIVAGAYFCTGFVRRAIESWWSVYLAEVLGVGRTSWMFTAFVWGLPITATLGSMASGFVSDRIFAGRRAPVAAVLYIMQVLLTAMVMVIPHTPGTAAWAAVALIIAIGMMCNSTHSILGTAAPMDLGGRKMAGCAAGIIDSFQYYGALLSGYGLGSLFDYVSRHYSGGGGSSLSPMVWFGSMLPFGVLGASLMTYLSLRHRKSHVRGT
jgi:OPA family glycerol-3-phosphate transporter-like MFS transporter